MTRDYRQLPTVETPLVWLKLSTSGVVYWEIAGSEAQCDEIHARLLRKYRPDLLEVASAAHPALDDE